ncbi:phage tail tape measure protein [Stenotrophomonas sp. ATCM1_4]|uniref:phage tail tape measure protein n=1 Tax=Stenotrophomonas sp. ATCM1_4 TaxID=2259330 RepID=UPI0010445C8F|nr:phage tail tape measure protein [Stenotrophomonas sp. ATCM1_4]TDB28406.1 phage tail tape measure protein [Stenotrophomonas sp. ATCM1_4]
MAEPSANLRVRISADLADIRQGLGVLTRQLRDVRSEAARPLPAKNPIADLGVSAGQTAQAMRQLPAQFTDIFTSLQGGMPFFTVLVQQGGQIKDSFGGVEPALKGVSQALLGLVNPYTVAAAAVGLIVYAWYDAEKQQEAYTRSLVLSRNEAAATTLDLVTLAQRTSEAMQVTAGAGEEVAQAIGANGRIAERNMQAVASAAVAMKEISGQAIEDTVALYAKLADEPVKNAQKLNEQVNFMTVDLYEHIKALQEQGRNQDAATVITRAASDETVMALAKVRANQNPVIRGFKELWAEATKAWGAMQGTMGFGPQAAQMQQMLADNRRDVARLNAIAASDDPRARNPHVISALAADVRNRSDKIKQIAVDLIRERKDAELKAAQAATVEYFAEVDDIVSAQASKSEKLRAEIARVNGEAEMVRQRAQAAGMLEEVKKIEERRVAAVAAIEKKYEEKGKTSGIASATRTAGLQGYRDDLVREQATIAASTQSLRAQFAARQVSAEDYYRQMRELVQQSTDADARSLEGQISFLRGRTAAGREGIVVQRQLAELEARLAKVRIDGAAKLDVLKQEEQASEKTRTNVVAAYTAALEASNAALRRHMETRVAQVGMGDREYEIQQQINDAYADSADKLRQLTLQRNADQIDQRTFEEEQAALHAKTLDRVLAIRDGYAELQEAEGNWLLGAKGAWANYQEEAGNAAKQMGGVVGSVFSGLEDVWVRFTETGKVSFSDMTKSILADLARTQIKKAISGIGETLFDGLLSGGAAGAAGAAGTGGMFASVMQKLLRNGKAEGGYTGPGGKFEPAGIVHKGEVVWSQADIARAGGVGIVEAMRRGVRAFADGGVVGGGAPAMGVLGGINVNVRNAPQGTTASASRNASGGVDVEVLLGEFEQHMAGRVGNGQGPLYGAMKGRFNLSEGV